MVIKVKLNELMGKQRLKISELSVLSGVHRNVLTKYYEDKIERLDKKVMAKICVALKCNIEDLFEVVEDE